MEFQIALLLVITYIVAGINVRGIARLLSLLTDEHEVIVWWLSLFFLPGTFLHEAGHLVVAEFLLVRTADLQLVPEIQHDGSVKLGSVQIAPSDPVRRMVIGIAPLLFGALIIGLGTYAVSIWQSPYIYALYAYMSVQISHTMFASKRDMQGFIVGFFGAVILVVLGRYLFSLLDLPVLYLFLTRFIELWSNYALNLRIGLWYGLLINGGLLVLIHVPLLLFRKKRQ